MDQNVKILKSEYLTEGLQYVELSNGESRYLCGDYVWKDRHLPKHVSDLGLDRRKAGIQSESLFASDFLLSLKRTSTIGREMVYWNIDCMPADISKDQAIKIRKWEDSLFKDLMEPYRSELLWNDPTIGTEVYEAKAEDIDQIIKDNKTKSWGQAFEIVLGKDHNQNVELPTGNVYRGTQEKQIEEILDGLSKYDFVQAETPPGGGKTPISYFVRRKIKNLERVTIYFTDTINNTIQSLWKFHQYHSNDGKIIKNPIAICTGDQKDERIIKSGARLIPASVIESNLDDKSLENILYEISSTENEYNIFCTYYSSEAFLTLIERWNINNPSLKFPVMYRDCDEIHFTSEKEITHNFNAIYRYQNLFSRGIGFSGTLIRRPEGFVDKNIVYNGDINYGGPIVSVVTEQEARGCGQIADQKVLIYPFPINEGLRSAIKAKKDISILLGKSKITGKKIRVKEKASMLLVQNALVTVTKQFKKHHIHLPFVKRNDAKKAFVFVKRMQEAGLLSDKYKLYMGLREDGNDTLEKFKKEEFAIVFGTRWMNRGTDTENCDCQIYTYIPSAEDIAVQLKGRTHRPHSSKDYSLLVIIDFEDEIKENPLYNVIEKNSKGLGYNIIGKEVSIPEIDYTKVVDEEILSTSANHTDGNIRDTDLLIMESPDSNPDLFAIWKKIVKSITYQTYNIDGIDSFTVMNRINKMREDLFDKIDSMVKECESNDWSAGYARDQAFKIIYKYVPYILYMDKGKKLKENRKNTRFDPSIYSGLPDGVYISINDYGALSQYEKEYGMISSRLIINQEVNDFFQFMDYLGINSRREFINFIKLGGYKKDLDIREEFKKRGTPDYRHIDRIYGKEHIDKKWGEGRRRTGDDHMDIKEIKKLLESGDHTWHSVSKIYKKTIDQLKKFIDNNTGESFKINYSGATCNKKGDPEVWRSVIPLIAENKSNAEICRELGISGKTMQEIIANIKKEGLYPEVKDPLIEKAKEILHFPLSIEKNNHDKNDKRKKTFLLKSGDRVSQSDFAFLIGLKSNRGKQLTSIIEKLSKIKSK